MPLLATLAELSDFKPLEGATALVRALQLLRSADAWARQKIGEDPEIATSTHRVDGGEGFSSLLFLPRWPILSVTTLTVDGATWTLIGDSDDESSQDAQIGPKGYYLESRFQCWPSGRKNIKVTYSAGFSAAQLANIKTSVIMLTHLLLAETSLLGQGQMTIGDMQVQQVVRNPKDYQFIMDSIFALQRPVF